MRKIPETGRTNRVEIRLVALQILVISLLLTLGGRLWYLQIRNGDEYTAEATSNHVQEVVTPATRGSLLDANGVPIADNETRLVVSVSRTELMRQKDGGKAVLARLADVLGMSSKAVSEKVRLCDAKTRQPCWNGSPYQPIPITDETTTQQALQIMERREEFPGVTAEPTAVRRYPAPDGLSAAQVLGYLSPVTDDEIERSEKAAEEADDNAGRTKLQRSDQIGRSGLERTYDSDLRGTAGVTRYQVDKVGRVIGKGRDTVAKPGSSVITSLDSRVQKVAEDELDTAMKAARSQFDSVTGTNYKADSGAVVVMEAKTGRVVAMASAPRYDPNVWVGGISAADYAKLTGSDSNTPLLNRATQGQAAPGSIFKVVSASAAVRAGYEADGRYNCSSAMNIGGQEFKNFESESFGPISLARALEVSCDTVFYGLAYDQWLKDGGMKPKHPKDYFFNTAHRFGLGKATGIDLPSEATGRVPDRKWKKNYWEANKDAWCEQAKSKGHDYSTTIAKENCKDGYRMRAGDAVNYSIGQGDTLVTPIQMASIYAAVSNGGTLYTPTIGKAVVSSDGESVKKIQPAVRGRLPISNETLHYIDKALEGVALRGTAAWRFGGWPQDKIPMHAKTGTAEVYGKQTTSWFATYTNEYSVVMTISQGGTGSGASGPAVRNIYNALYGIQSDGSIDKSKALLPKPKAGLPKIAKDGTVEADSVKPIPTAEPSPGADQAAAFVNPAAPGSAPDTPATLALLPPDRPERWADPRLSRRTA